MCLREFFQHDGEEPRKVIPKPEGPAVPEEVWYCLFKRQLAAKVMSLEQLGRSQVASALFVTLRWLGH